MQRRDKEDKEYQIWQACGRQISSRHPTAGSSAFGASQLLPSNKVGERQPRSPGPGKYSNLIPPIGSQPSAVLRGWGTVPRFYQAPSEHLKVTNIAREEAHSTNASVFSPVYPYQEAPSHKPSLDGEAAAEAAEGDAVAAGEASPPASARASPRRRPGHESWEDAERRKRREAQRLPDYGGSVIKYKTVPAYSFGGGGAYGHRRDKKFLFREMRDTIRPTFTSTSTTAETSTS